jgi:hypothetical protein
MLDGPTCLFWPKLDVILDGPVEGLGMRVYELLERRHPKPPGY